MVIYIYNSLIWIFTQLFWTSVIDFSPVTLQGKVHVMNIAVVRHILICSAVLFPLLGHLNCSIMLQLLDRSLKQQGFFFNTPV